PFYIGVVDHVRTVGRASDSGIVARKRDIHRHPGLKRADSRELPVTEGLAKETVVRGKWDVVYITQHHDVLTVEVAVGAFQVPMIAVLVGVAGNITASVVERMRIGIGGLKRQ